MFFWHIDFLVKSLQEIPKFVVLFPIATLQFLSLNLCGFDSGLETVKISHKPLF